MPSAPLSPIVRAAGWIAALVLAIMSAPATGLAQQGGGGGTSIYSRSNALAPQTPSWPPTNDPLVAGRGVGVASSAAPGGSHAITPPIAPAAMTPEQWLDRAVAVLEGRESLAAKLRCEVDLFDHRLRGAGVYVERRPGRDRLFRLEVRMQATTEIFSLVQVCDGRYLWTYRNLPSETNLSRVDVVRAERTIQGESTPVPDNVLPLPGLGGLPRLLRGLRSNFDFTMAEPGRWGASGKLVWRLSGQWNRTMLARLLPDQKEKIESGDLPDLSQLPAHLADRIVVVLGQDDLFPYRLEFVRSPDPGSDPTAARVVMAVDFYDPAFDIALDPNQFVYNPGDVNFTDETDAFIDRRRAKSPP